MEKIKKTLPKWIHDSVESITERLFLDDFQFITIDGKHLNSVQLINEERLAEVWESLDKALKDKNTGNYKMELTIGSVLGSLYYGLMDPPKWENYSSARRVNKAKTVRLLCDKLVAELEPYVDNGERMQPPNSELYAGYGSLSYFTALLTQEFIETLLKVNPKSELANYINTESDNDSYFSEDIIRTVFWYAINRTPDILESICSGLEDHAQRKPIMYRPNEPGAKRMRFARVVTNMFMKKFGRPFREEVWVITSLFFDVGGLEPSYLSKIAKVNKNPRNK